MEKKKRVVKIEGTEHFKININMSKFEYGKNIKVALIDGDGSKHFPNLSLQKISAWEKRNGVKEVKLIKLKHQRKGGVLGIHPDSLKELEDVKYYDRVYASFIFTRSKPVAKLLTEIFPNIHIGGTGYDEYFELEEGDLRAKPKCITQLPYPIENMYPDHELYESETADENCEFWKNPNEFKVNRNSKKYIEEYGIKPLDGTWGSTELDRKINEDVIRKYEEYESSYGYKKPEEYRGSTRGVGYSSKGCPRKCTFCVVPIIQGDIVPQSYGLLGVINWILPKNFYPTMDEIIDLYQSGKLKMRPHLFWDTKGGIKRISPFLTISDNNFPADPTCIEKMDYMINNNIAVNLNQGIDARLLTSKSRVDKNGIRFPSGDEICERLSKLYFMNFKGTARSIHFAWDFLSVGRLVLKGLSKLVEDYGLSYSNFTAYCLSGFNTNFEEDYKRVLTLKEMKIDPYIMLFRNVDGSEGCKQDGTPQDWRMKHLARWTNNKIIFRKTPFEEYEPYVKELKARECEKYTEEQHRIASIEVFDWLTDDYINHA